MRLLRLISAHRDMQYSLIAFNSFEAARNGDERYSFFLSMVICYGRPFTESNGLGRIEVEYPSYPDFDNVALNDAHTRLMKIRHDFLAHSSITGTIVTIVPPRVLNVDSGEILAGWSFQVGKREFLRPDFVALLAKTVAALHDRLLADIKEMLPLNPTDQISQLSTGEFDGWTD